MTCVVVMVESEDRALQQRAEDLARELGLPLLIRNLKSEFLNPLALLVTDDHLVLKPLSGDASLTRGSGVVIEWWKDIDTTSPAGRSLKQPITRAVGLRSGARNITVLDVTAGLGGDAWLLAALGARVTMVERNAVLFAMLRDALRRAHGAAPEVAGRLTLLHADGRDVLGQLGERDKPDVVYLDPMFESGRKTMERKPLRVLRTLVGEGDDARDLLAPALAAAGKRVVVKRARRAPTLGGEPVAQHEGRGLRFDVYRPATDHHSVARAKNT